MEAAGDVDTAGDGCDVNYLTLPVASITVLLLTVRSWTGGVGTEHLGTSASKMESGCGELLCCAGNHWYSTVTKQVDGAGMEAESWSYDSQELRIEWWVWKTGDVDCGEDCFGGGMRSDTVWYVCAGRQTTQWSATE